MWKRILFYLYGAVLAVGMLACSSDSPAEGTLEEKPPLTHTLIVYMMGADNGLAGFMDKNIQQILGSLEQVPEHGRVALFYDRGNYTRLTELTLEDGVPRQRLIKDFNVNASTVEPDFMKAVLDLVVKEVPSQSYGLVMSSHGGGWLPANVFDEHISDKGRMLRKNPVPATRFFGQDKYDCMEIPELASVLEQYSFDYVLFDACFMASVEGLYDLRNAADYIVASSAEVVGSGFPYKKILPFFFNGLEGLKGICKEYMKYYREGNAEWVSATISLVDMSQMNALASATRNVFQSGFRKVDASEVQPFEGMTVHCYFDFAQYVRQGNASVEALENFERVLKQAVVFADHTETIYSDYGEKQEIPVNTSCGLTCHIAQDSRPLTAEAYWDTEWAKLVWSK